MTRRPTKRTTPSRRWRYKRLPLYPKQEAALFAPARYAVIEGATKSGKTVGAMAWLLEQAARGRQGDNFWWVAPVAVQASMVWNRYKTMLRCGGWVAQVSRMTLILPNGAVLWFKSGDHPDGLYGENVCAAVIDEATRVKEAAWHAVRSTVTATKGPIRIIGNVKGRQNWAYRFARLAQGGAENMHYARLTARDAIEAGLFDATELRDAEAVLPAAVFRELYYAEASDDQGNPFGLQAIRDAICPVSSGTPFVWGWDLAKSRDWTVGIALDADGNVCRVERFQRPWNDTFEIIRRITQSVPALIDSTGVGDPLVERLQRLSGRRFSGFTFTAASKQQLMMGLAAAIQEGRIGFPEGTISSELEAFEYRYTRTGVEYCAPEGVHDDCVMALALALKAYDKRAHRVPYEVLFTGSTEDDYDEEIEELEARLGIRLMNTQTDT